MSPPFNISCRPLRNTHQCIFFHESFDNSIERRIERPVVMTKYCQEPVKRCRSAENSAFVSSVRLGGPHAALVLQLQRIFESSLQRAILILPSGITTSSRPFEKQGHSGPDGSVAGALARCQKETHIRPKGTEFCSTARVLHIGCFAQCETE